VRGAVVVVGTVPVPEQWAQGALRRCGQRVRSTQTAEEMQRRRTRESERRSTRQNIKQDGHPK